MKRIASVVLGMMGVGAAVACGSSSQGSGSELEVPAVCPGCRPTVGGETSDFGGGRENCREEEAPLSDADATALDIEAVRAAAAAPLDLPLRWHAEGGTDETTTVRATFELGEARYFAIGVEVSNACRDAIRIPTTVTLETEDGGLSATMAGTLQQRRGDGTWELRASADLSLVDGERELAIDTSRPHIGRLQLVIHGFPGQRRGEVRPEVLYVDESWADASFDDALELGGTPVTPWGGVFPVDACGSIAIPVAAGDSHPFLANRTVQDVFGEVRSVMPPWAPGYSLRRGAYDEVLVELAPDVSSACLGNAFGSPWLDVRGDARIETRDGSFDFGVDQITLHLTPESAAPAMLVLERSFEAQSPASLALAMGIQGADFSGHQRVSGELRADYAWTPNGLDFSGRVCVRDADTLEELDRLTWPMSDQAPTNARD